MEKAIADLSKNVMFNLSKSSNELFHSEFISWLINNYPAYITKVFQNLTGIQFPFFDFCKREDNHLDLSIYSGDSCIIVVENKVKSYPSEDQLTSYNEKVKGYINKPSKILLTFINPTQTNSIGDWQVINYSELAFQLQEMLPMIENDLKSVETMIVINSYIEFINKLFLVIQKSMRIEENAIFDFHSERNHNYQELSKIRLQYMYQKWSYLAFAQHVYRQLLETEIFPPDTFVLTETWMSVEDKINISSWFTTRSNQPLVDFNINFPTKTGSAFGILIQGNHFKIYSNKIQKDKKNPISEDSINELLDKISALLNNNDSIFDEPDYRKKINGNNRYTYKWLRIKDNVSVGAITNIIISELTKLYNENI